MAGYLQQRGREPHDPNEGEPDESSSQRNVLGAAEDEEQGGRRLDQHRRSDDVGREAGVSVGVEGEPAGANPVEERIVHYLNEPDYADHNQRRREVYKEYVLHRAKGATFATGPPAVSRQRRGPRVRHPPP